MGSQIDDLRRAVAAQFLNKPKCPNGYKRANEYQCAEKKYIHGVLQDCACFVSIYAQQP